MCEPYEIDIVVTANSYKIYLLAADIGTANFVTKVKNDLEIMHYRFLINLNVQCETRLKCVKKILCFSSECIYFNYNQPDLDNKGWYVN